MIISENYIRQTSKYESAKAKTSKISSDETHIKSVVNATENVHFSCPHAELIKYSFQNLKAIVTT